jgi:hypothetical protein
MALYGGDTEKKTRFSLVDIYPRGTASAGNDPLQTGSGGSVPLVIKVPTTQSVDAIELQLANKTIMPNGGNPVLWSVDLNGNQGYLGGVNGAGQKAVQVLLTAAQITTLHSVPVSLVAAPAAGFVIAVDAMTFSFKYGTLQFTGGGVVSPVYHGATTNLLSGGVAAATIQAAASAVVALGGPASALALTTATGVDLYSTVADFAAGDSTALVTLWYSVLAI